MAGEEDAAAAAASPAAVRKPPKEEEEDDDELDNVPLAISRAKKSGNASASKVKKEEDDEEDNMPISRSRGKKGNEKQKGTTNSNMKASKVKKEEADSDDDGDFMPISQKKSAGAAGSNAKTSKVKKLKDEDLEDLKEVKKRKKRVGVKEEANLAIVKAEKVKKERKVYELPGQKHDPPAERDPLRIFYESLYEQVPTSDMAATWLMEWGLLPLDVATKVFEKKQGQKLKSPVKTPVAKRKPSSRTPTKALPSSAKKSVASAKSAGKLTSQKKRKASDDTDDDDDDDFMAPKTKTKRHKA